MTKVRYLMRWTNGENRPVPLYIFYRRGRRCTDGLRLREALRAFPESKYEWEQIRE